MCFVTIGSLERVKKMSQYRISRLTTVAVQREEKRRTVAYIETASYS